MRDWSDRIPEHRCGDSGGKGTTRAELAGTCSGCPPPRTGLFADGPTFRRLRCFGHCPRCCTRIDDARSRIHFSSLPSKCHCRRSGGGHFDWSQYGHRRMTAGTVAAFPPHVLREYALIADGERGALIGPRGDISWMCMPSWDSPSLFTALIGGTGIYAVTPISRFVWGGYYEPGSLIWRSRWVTDDGIVECREALAFPGHSSRGVATTDHRCCGRCSRARPSRSPNRLWQRSVFRDHAAEVRSGPPTVDRFSYVGRGHLRHEAAQ